MRPLIHGLAVGGGVAESVFGGIICRNCLGGAVCHWCKLTAGPDRVWSAESPIDCLDEINGAPNLSSWHVRTQSDCGSHFAHVRSESVGGHEHEINHEARNSNCQTLCDTCCRLHASYNVNHPVIHW